MATQYRCKGLARRKEVAKTPGLNGIDYLEVSGDQLSLKVNLFHEPAPATTLSEDNVVIEGGVRIQAATIGKVETGEEQVIAGGELAVESVMLSGSVLTVMVNTPGDFSTYTLRLVRSPTNLLPPLGFDPLLSAVSFSFKADCPSEFDCAPELDCPPERLPEPEINYLAKDYASFRRLMLDRLSVVMPDWQERNPADVLVTLVEALAYVGDHLSYYQDAVATEAYLGTARRRASIRRHARLLDYFMHDGSNARAWVCFRFEAGGGPDRTLPEGTQLLTRGPVEQPTLDPADLDKTLRVEKPEVFETLHAVTLQQARNEIHFYTWGDSRCCLPRGATRASVLKRPSPGDPDLTLARGDVLVFEEVKGPTTGLPEDADPAHRHAVRLTAVEETADPLTAPPTPVINIEWGAEDALPFPLCISAELESGQQLADVSVARGNVALADHGRRFVDEPLGSVPQTGRFRPRLDDRPLTMQGHVFDRETRSLIRFDPQASASAAMRYEMRNVRPWVTLQGGGEEWTPRRDLLNSSRFRTDFLVETEPDGPATLRFGDNVLGKRPAAGAAFTATYRIGNGTQGNVGAEAIARVVSADTRIKRVWNTLPASGGTDPESLEQVRQVAPQAFRVQERAVTEADYVELARRRADVQHAAASLRWTGSWYTAFVTVDRRGGLPVDAPYRREMRGYLDRYRLAGYDLEINSPVFVPLDVALKVCVKAGYFRSDVKDTLLRVFSSRDLPGGKRGFFHPDNFTFGQPVYLSHIYEAAMAVDGVDSVEVARFQRWGKAANQEREKEVLAPGPFEVVRLDNDPNFPENGKIEFHMMGGL